MNVNMNSMPMAGGPVGGPMPMAGNNALAAGSQVQRPPENNRANLNTYIYDYFIREGMFDCARAMLNSDQALNVHKNSPRRSDDMGDDPMDTDSKDDIDVKRPSDLPAPNVPNGGDSCFLYEWFCLFWDMLSAQRNKGGVSPNVSAYVNHTQNTVRMRQAQQQEMLRGMPYNNGGMMRMPNGMPMKAGPGQNLMRTAIGNNQNNPSIMLQANKNQMQRDGSNMDGNANRPASPGGADNAPSPSKRPRLDGGGPFNPQHPNMMNGQRPQPGGQGFTNFQKEQPQIQARSIQTYAATLQQHHGQQMPNKQGPNAVGPQGQGSPSMMPGADPPQLGTFYNAEMNPQGMRQGAGPGQSGGSNHALQDYQMQLMLLEQQNKKRLMMARQEQDSMGGGMPRGDGSGPNGPGGPPGPNGQSFQDGSPQGVRPGASPNPSEQMKRGTPQMNPAGIPSPLPDGARAGGSPNAGMGFMPNGMDPNMQKQFYQNMNGMENGMVAAGQMNGGMRPPSSHPNQPFTGQMNPQMMAARQQGPPGQQQMVYGNGMAPQGPPQGTPQQRMPPPSAPAAGANTNGRTNTSSPQTSNAAPPTPQQSAKAAPKKKEPKNAKKGATTKKAAQASGAGATPAADASQEAEPPTPATPITPVNPGNFKPGQNGAAQPAAPASVAQAPPAPVAAPPEMNFGDMTDNSMFGIGDFLPGNGDVLPDFDFDSFLHDNTDGDGSGFDFNPATFGMGEEQGPIGAD